MISETIESVRRVLDERNIKPTHEFEPKVNAWTCSECNTRVDGADAYIRHTVFHPLAFYVPEVNPKSLLLDSGRPIHYQFSLEPSQVAR